MRDCASDQLCFHADLNFRELAAGAPKSLLDKDTGHKRSSAGWYEYVHVDTLLQKSTPTAATSLSDLVLGCVLSLPGNEDGGRATSVPEGPF